MKDRFDARHKIMRTGGALTITARTDSSDREKRLMRFSSNGGKSSIASPPAPKIIKKITNEHAKPLKFDRNMLSEYVIQTKNDKYRPPAPPPKVEPPKPIVRTQIKAPAATTSSLKREVPQKNPIILSPVTAKSVKVNPNFTKEFVVVDEVDSLDDVEEVEEADDETHEATLSSKDLDAINERANKVRKTLVDQGKPCPISPIEGSRIFVRNLTVSNINERELLELFSNCGPIKYLRKRKDKIRFVDYKDALTAVKAYNDVKYLEHTLKVTMDKDQYRYKSEVQLPAQTLREDHEEIDSSVVLDALFGYKKHSIKTVFTVRV